MIPRILLASWMSYRSLLTWLSPPSFVGVKILNPVGQILLFTLIGSQYADSRGAEFFIVGNALLLSAFGGIYGTSITLAQARSSGMLAYLAVTPTRRAWLLGSFGLMNICDGLLTGAVLLVSGLAIVGVAIASWGGVVLALLTTAFSAGAVGLIAGQISLALRDQWGTVMNVAFFLTLLLSGANLPADALPVGLRTLAGVWPMSHGIEAARQAVESPHGFGESLAIEAATGAGLVALALVFVAATESYTRRTGAVHTWG
jgi:ABC-type polysaccharide/polyol phosphate export permease